MDQLLEDYKAYYNTRMQRYAGDPMFGRSYSSEKDLYDCVCSANSMNELMQEKAAQFSKLSIQNGVAFIQDQSNYKLQFYLKEKDKVKAKGQLEIIDAVNAATDAMQIVSVVNEIIIKNDKEVLIDNLWPAHFFTDAIDWLEKIDVIKKAAVPDNWKAIMQKQEAELIALFQSVTSSFINAIRNYEPGWSFNYELLWEHRHRKKCPLPDVVLQNRIQQHKVLYTV